MKLYMFRTVRLSIIRNLFTAHSAMVYVIQVCGQLSGRFYYKEMFYDARSHERKKLWTYLLIFVSWVHIFKSWYESLSVWRIYFRNFARKLKRYFVYKKTFPALIKRHKNANGKKLNNVQQNYVMAKSRQET